MQTYLAELTGRNFCWMSWMAIMDPVPLGRSQSC